MSESVDEQTVPVQQIGRGNSKRLLCILAFHNSSEIGEIIPVQVVVTRNGQIRWTCDTRRQFVLHLYLHHTIIEIAKLIPNAKHYSDWPAGYVITAEAGKRCKYI